MPSVTRGQSSRARRTARAEVVLDATEKLLAGGERFTELPVERLIAEAGVSRSAFYRYFGDKSELLAALANRAIDEIRDAAEAWWDGGNHEGPKSVEMTALTMIRAYRKHGAVLRAIDEVAGYDEIVNGLWRSRLDSYVALSATRMAQEQADGLIPADVDIELASALVVRLVETAVLDHVQHGAPRDDRRVAKAVARAGWLIRYGRIPNESP